MSIACTYSSAGHLLPLQERRQGAQSTELHDNIAGGGFGIADLQQSSISQSFLYAVRHLQDITERASSGWPLSWTILSNLCEIIASDKAGLLCCRRSCGLDGRRTSSRDRQVHFGVHEYTLHCGCSSADTGTSAPDIPAPQHSTSINAESSPFPSNVHCRLVLLKLLSPTSRTANKGHLARLDRLQGKAIFLAANAALTAC